MEKEIISYLAGRLSSFKIVEKFAHSRNTGVPCLYLPSGDILDQPYGCWVILHSNNHELSIEVKLFTDSNGWPECKQTFNVHDPDCFDEVVEYARKITQDIRWGEWYEYDD